MRGVLLFKAAKSNSFVASETGLFEFCKTHQDITVNRFGDLLIFQSLDITDEPVVFIIAKDEI